MASWGGGGGGGAGREQQISAAEKTVSILYKKASDAERLERELEAARSHPDECV